jgi:hypothetical protein
MEIRRYDMHSEQWKYGIDMLHEYAETFGTDPLTVAKFMQGKEYREFWKWCRGDEFLNEYIAESEMVREA